MSYSDVSNILTLILGYYKKHVNLFGSHDVHIHFVYLAYANQVGPDNGSIMGQNISPLQLHGIEPLVLVPSVFD
jgi:hypothetical protein